MKEKQAAKEARRGVADEEAGGRTVETAPTSSVLSRARRSGTVRRWAGHSHPLPLCVRSQQPLIPGPHSWGGGVGACCIRIGPTLLPQPRSPVMR